jgi:hypothetical protein
VFLPPFEEHYSEPLEMIINIYFSESEIADI